MELTPKQERFIEEYMIDLNATQAAIRAGYSEKTAEVQGPRLLGNVRVKEEIEKRQQNRAEKFKIDQEWVLKRLKDISDWCTDEEHYDPSGANKSTELIGKHLGMFKDKVEVSGTDGGPLEFKWKSDESN